MIPQPSRIVNGGGDFGEDTGASPPPHWADLHEQVDWIIPDGEESQ